MIRTITSEQLRSKTEGFIDSTFGTPAGDRVEVIEVGPAVDYARVHIRRATHLTPAELQGDLQARLPNPGAEFVLYSGTNDDQVIFDVAHSLAKRGYGNIYLYLNGKRDWIAKGLWTESFQTK